MNTITVGCMGGTHHEKQSVKLKVNLYGHLKTDSNSKLQSIFKNGYPIKCIQQVHIHVKAYHYRKGS